ncbi:hypothetical protein SARC_14160, partial [Sphaeroforma arctica JP610]
GVPAQDMSGMHMDGGAEAYNGYMNRNAVHMSQGSVAQPPAQLPNNNSKNNIVQQQLQQQQHQQQHPQQHQQQHHHQQQQQQQQQQKQQQQQQQQPMNEHKILELAQGFINLAKQITTQRPNLDPFIKLVLNCKVDFDSFVEKLVEERMLDVSGREAFKTQYRLRFHALGQFRALRQRQQMEAMQRTN